MGLVLLSDKTRPDNGRESRRSQVLMTLMPWAADVLQWRWTNSSEAVTLNDTVKPRRSSDRGLELVLVKPEFTVIAHKNGAVNLIWALYLPPVSV
jgi:hypothetical protein